MVDVRFMTYGPLLNGDYGYGTVMYIPPGIEGSHGPSMSYMMIL
jgi:hypothetical protein